jgi:hypothetical protein
MRLARRRHADPQTTRREAAAGKCNIVFQVGEGIGCACGRRTASDV